MKHNYALIPGHQQPVGRSIGQLVLLALGAWLLGVPVARSQDAQQFRLGLFAEADPVKTSAFMADGGSVMIVEAADQDVLWRGSADGSPLWSKVMPLGTLDQALFPRQDGGLYVADAPLSPFIEQGDLDSGYAEVNVRSLASDGTELWNRHLRMGFTLNWVDGVLPEGIGFDISGTVRVGDELLVGLAAASKLFLVLLDPSGSVVWSQEVMDSQYTGDEDETWMPSGMGFQNLNWVSTADGSFVAMLNDYTITGLRLLKIDASGSVGWAKRFVYANNMVGLEGSAVLLSSGDLLITAPFTYWVPGVPGTTPQLLAFRMDQAGAILAKDLYQSVFGGRLVALPNDGWATCSGALTLSGSRTDLLEVGASGDVVQGWRAATTESGGFSYSPRAKSIGLDPDGFRIGLSMKRVHTFFTTLDYAVGGTRVTAADPGCLFEPQAYEHFTIPDSLMTEEPLPSVHSVPDIASVMAVSPLAGTTPLTTSGLCELLVTVPEIAEQAFTVVNMIGNASQPIQVTTTETRLLFRFVSMTGSLVSASVGKSASGRIELPVRDLAVGTYILEAVDRRGLPKGRTRIVVQ